MAEIKQYFAPTRRLMPSERGFSAEQEVAGAEARTAEAYGRVGETWAQAARRLGSISAETAESYRQIAALQKEQGALSKQGYDLSAEDIKSLRGLEPTPAPPARTPGVKIKGDPNALLDSIHKADAIDAKKAQAKVNADDLAQRRAQTIAARAASLFGKKPTIPLDPYGNPLYRDSQGTALTEEQETAQLRQQSATREQATTQRQQDAATQKAAGYPTNPDTKQPYTASQWDLQQRQDEIMRFNQGQFDRQQRLTTPMPINPATGQPFTQQEYSAYTKQRDFTLNQQSDVQNQTGTDIKAPVPSTANPDDDPANTFPYSGGLSQQWENIKASAANPPSPADAGIDTTDPAAAVDQTVPVPDTSAGTTQEVPTPDQGNASPPATADQTAPSADQTGLVVPIPAAPGGQ